MVLAILQARTSSKRLPGKVLLPILGAPMLARQIERVRRAKTLSRLVLATSRDAADDPLAEFCAAHGLDCHRGELDDVLSRYIGALDAFGPAEAFVRLTADCPLTDPDLIDETVRAHLRAKVDYTHIQSGWTFPKGLDVEVCQTDALRAVAREASGEDREHVTSFIYGRPQGFKILALRRDPPLRYRWTVDTAEDYAFVVAVYEALYPRNPAFSTADVLDWQAAHPERAIPNLAADAAP